MLYISLPGSFPSFLYSHVTRVAFSTPLSFCVFSERQTGITISDRHEISLVIDTAYHEYVDVRNLTLHQLLGYDPYSKAQASIDSIQVQS